MRIIIILLVLSLSGCCCLSGVGMKEAQQKRQEREDKMHEAINKVFNRISS